jgi:SnoaL-like domain
MSAEDDIEIRNVLARVAHITDGRGSMEEYVALWTEDCSWESPVAGSYQGHEGHLARHARYRDAGVQGPQVDSFHVLTTVWVKVEDSAAAALSTWLLIVDADTNPLIRDIGTYTDTLRRTSDGWKLVTRKVSQGSGDWLSRLPSSTNFGSSRNEEG